VSSARFPGKGLRHGGNCVISRTSLEVVRVYLPVHVRGAKIQGGVTCTFHVKFDWVHVYNLQACAE